jgi:hypothetical protein
MVKFKKVGLTVIMEVLNMKFNDEQIQGAGYPDPPQPPRRNLTSKQKTKIEFNRRF